MTMSAEEKQQFRNSILEEVNAGFKKQSLDVQKVVDANALGLSERIEQVAAAQQGYAPSPLTKDRVLGVLGETLTTEICDDLSKVITVNQARTVLLGASEKLISKLNLEDKQRKVILLERRTLIMTASAFVASAAATSYFLTRHYRQTIDALRASSEQPAVEQPETV